MILNSFLFQKEPHQFFVEPFIWLVTHGQIKPVLFIYDTFIVREGVKSGFSVICPHSAFPEAAEAHLVCGKVNDGIVDAAAAEAAAGCDPAGKCLIPGEDIERQRMRKGVEIADDLILRVIGEDGQDRAEDLFLHHSIGKEIGRAHV